MPPPPTPGWLVALAVSLAGGALAFLALRAGGLRGGRLARYTAACAPGLGLGLASLLLFFWRVAGGGDSSRPGLGVFLLVAAALAGGVHLLGTRFGRAPEPPPPPAFPLSRLVRTGAWLAFAAGAVAVAASFWVISHAWPLGTWDAVAIWNVKARFLFRGYGQAAEVLKQVDPSSHPNYPLLVPGAVAAQWSMIGAEDPWTAPLTGLAFLAGLGLMALAVAADSGLPAFGAMAAALVWGNPMVLKWGGAQGADLAVAYCFLGSLAMLASRLPGRDGTGLPPLLGGVFLGLLAWSKNEGTLTVLILLGLYGLWAMLYARGRPEVWRDAVPLVAGALPGLAAVFLFKGLWAPESGLETFLQGHPLDRVLSLERWFVPVREIVRRLIPVGAGAGWAVSWPAVLAGAVLAGWIYRRERRPWASFWAAGLVATVGSWVPIFAVTPYGQMWHIEGSLDRLYLQVFPGLVAGVCLRLGLAVAAGPGQEAVPWRVLAEPARRRLAMAVPGWLAALLLLSLAAKGYVISAWLPRIWLFLDELFYFVAAWDLGHWGAAGVPHPDFLFYPPLTSALIAPLLALGIDPPLVYHLGLLLFHALLTSAVVAAWLLMRRLFGESFRLLPCVLLFGPPAYAALALMSEPVFIALYIWFLYVWVRLLQERRRRDAWTAGLLLAGLVLTRFAGYLVVGCLALGAAADFAFRKDRREGAALLKLHLLALAPPLVTAVLWRMVGAHLRPETTQSPMFMLAIVVNFPLEMVLGTARRLLAEIGYVSLSTYGFALPAALWGLVRRGGPTSAGAAGERARTLRLFLFNVLAFLVLASGIAALFMWFGHFLSYLPRFDLYGRYVEYFAIPLLVVAFGVFAAMRRQGSWKERAALSLGALALNAVLLLFVPEAFFTASQVNQVAPNSLGIAWLLRLVGEAGTWSRWLAPVLAALLVWGLTGRDRVRRATAGALVLLTVLNFLLGVREASINSMGSAVYSSTVSDYVSANPEPFAKGLYVDYPDYRREVGPEAVHHPLLYRVIADHLDKAVVGTHPEEVLGKLPVLTKRVFDRPVLMEWPDLPYRIYAAAPAPPAPR